ncbi:hypothetical protein ACVDFE_02190 [Lentzea chajnantorensis]
MKEYDTSVEPNLGGEVRVEVSGWPGGMPHVWLQVLTGSDTPHRVADVCLRPREVLAVCWQLLKAVPVVWLHDRQQRRADLGWLNDWEGQ